MPFLRPSKPYFKMLDVLIMLASDLEMSKAQYERGTE